MARLAPRFAATIGCAPIHSRPAIADYIRSPGATVTRLIGPRKNVAFLPAYRKITGVKSMLGVAVGLLGTELGKMQSWNLLHARRRRRGTLLVFATLVLLPAVTRAETFYV